MKRIIFTILLIAGVLSSVQARRRPAAPEPGHRWLQGLKAGVDLVAAGGPFTILPEDLNRGGLGLAFGYTARLQWRSGWYLQPSFLFCYDTAVARLNHIFAPDGDPTLEMRRGGVQVPLHLGYKFRLTHGFYVSVYSGGFASYGLTGSCSHDEQTKWAVEPPRHLFGSEGIWNRLAVGPVVGFTFEGRDFPVSMSVDGYFGVNHMQKLDVFRTGNMSATYIRLGFGYWFGMRDKNRRRHAPLITAPGVIADPSDFD
ncbi:MAG: PorT family protein [Muribaculaceae bacterium]|nr:PorT family protein [Muribaculaceae bacterium]